MPRRRLSPEEQAAWRQLARSVRPLASQCPTRDTEPQVSGTDAMPFPDIKAPKSLTSRPEMAARPVPRPAPADVLDGSWERRIKRGLMQPEMSIDLHGHSLSHAHQRLERALAEAIAQGARVLLIISGKARERSAQGGPPGRGAIRAEIGHWLERSPHADRIASVRNAHPRHGGAGALYVILRRKK